MSSQFSCFVSLRIWESIYPYLVPFIFSYADHFTSMFLRYNLHLSLDAFVRWKPPIWFGITWDGNRSIPTYRIIGFSWWWRCWCVDSFRSLFSTAFLRTNLIPCVFETVHMQFEFRLWVYLFVVFVRFVGLSAFYCHCRVSRVSNRCIDGDVLGGVCGNGNGSTGGGKGRLFKCWYRVSSGGGWKAWRV